MEFVVVVVVIAAARESRLDAGSVAVADPDVRTRGIAGVAP